MQTLFFYSAKSTLKTLTFMWVFAMNYAAAAADDSGLNFSKFPPLPIMPIPSARQLAFHKREMALFLHFGMNTFTDSEWGTGNQDPSTFDPSGLNARQWAQVAKDAGFKLMVLTAKHHDGFCLWPSAYTNYSVKSSPWMNGNGDVVHEFVSAAREFGLEVGLYLSPWDRHENCYGDTLKYNMFYLAQMEELLSRYGQISEVWLDGAKGENTTNMDYMFKRWFAVIHQLQPTANIFSDAGPDVRWVGDEEGFAGSTCWSMVNRSNITIGKSTECLGYLNSGDPYGVNWVPPECDISIRPGWFWHRNETAKNVTELLEVYYNSVGRNCVLLVNVPPNSTGLLDGNDVKVLQEFKSALDSIFSVNLAANSMAKASSTRDAYLYDASKVLESGLATYWAPSPGMQAGIIWFNLSIATTFNVVEIQEAIQLGQRVISYHLDVWNEGSWSQLTNGTTIGYKKLDRFNTTQGVYLRLVIEEARADPLIAFFGLYFDPYYGATCDIQLADPILTQQSEKFRGLQEFKKASEQNTKMTISTLL